MKEPFSLRNVPGEDDDDAPSGRKAGSRAAKKAGARAAAKAGSKPPAKKPSRPKRKVVGGKALARLNMFLIQRGMRPEPTDPAPPNLPATRTSRLRARAEARAKAPTAAADLAAGYQAVRRQLTAPATLVPQSWQPLGPYFIPHGQSYGRGPDSRPPVAGRVSSVAIDPTDEQHILCGSAGGGVWETRDGGRTWSPRTDDQPSLSIGAVAYDPSNPLRAYAGTGEGDSADSATKNIRAAGLLVSDDGGTKWRVMPGNDFIGISFYDLAVDPSHGKHILAATTAGLFETLDGGGKWKRRLSQLTWSVSMHPPVPTNPEAGREVLAGCEGGLFRSKNGGKSWSPVTLPGLPASFEPQRMAVRHAPSNGSVAYVFAAGPPDIPDVISIADGYPKSVMPTPYLWRRATFAGEFAPSAWPGDLQTGQAWYDWFLGVAPNNPDVIYLGAINAHRGARKPSGKWDWKNLSAKKPTGDCIHPDQHAIAFSPANPSVVFIGNDGGVYRSPDAGVSWEPLNKGLSITEVEFLTQHPEYDAWLLAGTQDNGTIRYEGQQTWYHVQDGDGGDCGVNYDDPYVCYHSYYGPHIEKSEGGGAWNDWSAITPEELDEEASLFYPPLEVNGKLVVRAATWVWLSRESGADGSWEAVELPNLMGCPSAMTAPTGDRVYVGAEFGGFYRIDWAAASGWQVTQLESPAPGFVSDIVVDPTDAASLWCSVNVDGQGGVYHSTDGGAEWDALSTGLPAKTAVHAIEIDPAAPATLFVGTDVGVFRTENGGGSWAAFGRGLPNVLVKDVLLHPKTRLLRAGTQARGVWEIALDAAATPDVHIYLRDHVADTGRRLPSPVDVPNPFARGTNLFWWQSPDIKVDASPFQVAGIDDLDFDVYSDDRSKLDRGIEFAVGLKEERPVRGQQARVYVQAHNRGSSAARDVAVRLFYITGGLNWPDLPQGFWAGFPDNTLPADSPWQAVAPHRVIPKIETGRSVIVGFDWSVPLNIGGAVGLLAVVSADNDALATTTLNVADLVRNSRFCALRNLAVVNPSPLVGPWSPALAVDVWPTASAASFSLDREARSLVRGVLMNKSLGAAARKAGWKQVKLSEDDVTHLTRLTDARPALRKRVDLGKAYHPPAKAAGVEFAGGTKEGPQPLVLLLKSRDKRGSGTLVMREADGTPSAGLTIVNMAGEES
ncbi:MAG TPA: hypothetical protein VIP46_01030 [Pyrinomonadaceae bacterium]